MQGKKLGEAMGTTMTPQANSKAGDPAQASRLHHHDDADPAALLRKRTLDRGRDRAGYARFTHTIT
jgi:hypothetical protein